MIWADMSYNQLDADFLNKLVAIELEKIKGIEVEEAANEFNQTNTFVFYSNGCVL